MAEKARPARALPKWWDEWAGRLDAEIERFEALHLTCEVVEDPRAGSERLVIESAVVSGGATIRVRVIYPDGYPHRRFQIFAPGTRLERHQAPNGDLCVLARGAKFWSPQILAADFVAEQVPKVIELVQAGGEALRKAEDPQGEPITTYYGGHPNGGVIVDDHAHEIDFSVHRSGTLQYMINADPQWMLPPPAEGHAHVGQAFVVLIAGARSVLADCGDHPLVKRFHSRRHDGRWVYLADPPLTDDPEVLWDKAVERDPSLTSWVRSSGGIKLLGVCVSEEVGQGTYAPSWFFLVRHVTNVEGNSRSGNPARRAQVIVGPAVVIRGLRWTAQAMGSRIPGLSALRHRTVSIAGLGSIGAPVVQELVKARTGTLRLLDGDHLDPGTSVRHPLGLADAGLAKPQAMARWAHSHDPGVEVEPEYMQIGTASEAYANESLRLARFLDGSDLLINATAEMDIARQLDRAALYLGIPRLHLWSQSGYGGIVALLRDGVTGCFHCLELALARRAEAGEPAVDVPAEDANWIQAPGCADQTFAATHVDLMPISIQAASVAFGQLNRGEGGYEAFDDDVFTVQTRTLEGKPLAPSWASFKLPPDPACPSCSA